MIKQQIQYLLHPYDSTRTECDGMAQICHTVLTNHNIAHKPMIGTLRWQEQEIHPHLWIDLPNGDRIDYRAKMWLSGEKIPHGVFTPEDFRDVIYIGIPIELDLLDPTVFKLLTLADNLEIKPEKIGERINDEI